MKRKQLRPMTTPLALCALALPCAAQQYTEEYEAWAARHRPETSAPMSALDFAQHMIELQKAAKDGETAWDYFKRNRITGPPIENSIEFEPNATTGRDASIR